MIRSAALRYLVRQIPTRFNTLGGRMRETGSISIALAIIHPCWADSSMKILLEPARIFIPMPTTIRSIFQTRLVYCPGEEAPPPQLRLHLQAPLPTEASK